MFKNFHKVTAIVLITFIMSGCSFSVQEFGNNKPAKDKPNTSNNSTVIRGSFKESPNDPNASAARRTPIVNVAQKLGPAVVGITNKGLVRDIFNRQILTERGTGSGVIFDANGFIVTNYHVIEGAREIAVSLADGRSVPGKIIGIDPTSDLAVVKIEAIELPIAIFGDSDKIMIGEPAIAIGNPLGLEFRGSVTVGVISALNRSLDWGERTLQLLQTDAAINPGNSGGALANADGVVIGINSAKINASGVEGLGFAIPINAVKKVISSIMETGKVARPYLGVALMDKDSAARYGYEYSFTKGVLVMKVAPDGPAAQSGLRKEDLILSINGQPTNSVKELRTILESISVGETVKIQVLRNNREQSLNVLIGELPVGN